ncbi:MAG: 2-oxo acid dehydrogenase subunit E2 [Deltaproteobacteria bacterium]|nr:2-oxo acid dehydrogenase subunit E2 [Deltaproteobacteria bacterium]
MPQLGESIVEATLAKWHVQPGDRVERGQVIAEVETDKATNEIPAPAAGVIGELVIAAGATVPVGTEILRYQGADRPSQARPRVPAAPPATSSAAARSAPAASPAAADPAPPAPPAAARPAPAATPERLPSRHLAARPVDASGRPRGASPAVRRIARERGIDLDGIAGSGRGGRITRDDVLTASSGAPGTPAPEAPRPARTFRTYRPPAVQPLPGDTVVPFSKRRRFIAEHMVHSLETAAHVAAVVEIDMGRVLAARSGDQRSAEAHGVRLTVTAYVVEAVAHALAQHPELNAAVREDALVLRRDKNIGVAVDTRDGLIVPVVRRADELGRLGIARAIDALTAKARQGSLTAEDLAGGTFTVSNPGRDGNLFGISIIRQPEVAILRMGEVVKRPVVRELEGEDAIVIRPVMFAALSYDHRVIDGSQGNAFLHRVRVLLEGVGPLP